MNKKNHIEEQLPIQDEKQFDVALSFAGEDREYVEKVANTLREMEIKVFYDKYEKVSLWGKDLFEHLIDVYQNKARYTIIFCSRHFEKKVWPNHERKAAQARALKSSQEYILPARFDKTEIPGILPTIGYVDLNEYSHEEFAEIIKEKVGPILRKNFFPYEPDHLYVKLKAKSKKFKHEIDVLGSHFLKALSLMTLEERKLLVTAFRNTCPMGPIKNNVHLNIHLLGRIVSKSVKEIISILARLDCLGIIAELKKEPSGSDKVCKTKDTIYIRYKPLAENSRIDNATFVAIAMIDIAFDNYCPDCVMRIIDSLDFSILSRKTGYPEIYNEEDS